MALPTEPKSTNCLALDRGEREKKNKKKRSREQERRVAGKLGGKRNQLSGAHPLAKGDAEVEHSAKYSFLIEAKRTNYKSIRVQGEQLRKISREAILENKTPLLAIELDTGEDGFVEKDWVMLPASAMASILEDLGIEIQKEKGE